MKSATNKSVGLITNKKDYLYLDWADDGARIFSQCSKRQYFCIIVSWDGSVISTGYNGAPAGMQNCNDGGCPHSSETPSERANDYNTCVAIHAEENALLRADWSRLFGGTLYVNGLPCFGCAKKIAGTTLTRVVVKNEPELSYPGWPQVEKFLLDSKKGVIVL